MIKSIKNKEALQNNNRLIMPLSRNSIYKIIATTLNIDDKNFKIIFILNKIFKIQTNYLEKIFKMHSTKIEDNIESFNLVTDPSC